MNAYDISDPKHPRHHDVYAGAADDRRKEALLDRLDAATARKLVRDARIRDAYRDGLSEGSEQGAAIMAENAELAPFEHALLEDDIAHAPTRERRAYLLGRLRGFRDTTRIKRWGAWSL